MLVATLAVGAFAGTAAGHGSQLRPGDLLRDHGIAVTVPAPGNTIWGELKMRDGTYQDLQVTTSRSGVVTVLGKGDEAAVIRALRLDTPPLRTLPLRPSPSRNLDAEPAATTGSAECSDRYHRLYSWRYRQYEWRFNAGSTPKYLASRPDGTAAVIAALAQANANVTDSRNVCGRLDKVSAGYAYLGTTERETDITSGGSCSAGDGRSVIAFGSLPGDAIAMVCVYSSGTSTAREADMRIDPATPWETEPGECDEEIYLQPAITHEFGHIYGLAHASASSHKHLTMHPVVPNCTRFQETLGWGDMLGLRKKY